MNFETNSDSSTVKAGPINDDPLSTTAQTEEEIGKMFNLLVSLGMTEHAAEKRLAELYPDANMVVSS